MERIICFFEQKTAYEWGISDVSSDVCSSDLIAVVGAGPAGLACATIAAERGHHVTLFDAADEIGGQFNLAKTIPGKEEFHETLRYFRHRIDETGVELRLSTRATPELLSGFDQ